MLPKWQFLYWEAVDDGGISLGCLRKNKDNHICSSCYLKNLGVVRSPHNVDKTFFRVNQRMSYERVNILLSRGRKSKEWKKADYLNTYICMYAGSWVCACVKMFVIFPTKGGGEGFITCSKWILAKNSHKYPIKCGGIFCSLAHTSPCYLQDALKLFTTYKTVFVNLLQGFGLIYHIYRSINNNNNNNNNKYYYYYIYILR